MKGVLLVTLSGFLCLMTAGGSAQTRTADIQRILLDTTLWGRDFPAVLALLRPAGAAADPSLYVFADRAAGSTAFRTTSAAQAAVVKAREVMAKTPDFLPALAAIQKQAAQPAGGPPRLETAKITDADGYHLVFLRTPPLELLSPGLTIAAVRARLGPPEQVTKKTIHALGESKPVVLTLSNYAGGAIAFAESSMADPGVVERVVLNVNAVSPAVVR